MMKDPSGTSAFVDRKRKCQRHKNKAMGVNNNMQITSEREGKRKSS